MRILRNSICLVALLAIASCQNLQTRDQVQPRQPHARTSPAVQPTPALNSAEAPSTPLPQTQSTPIPTPPPMPIATPPPKNNIRIGVIVGPGGLKTYAALGVFREMQRARIPVTSVVGLEWGAVIGGLYASQGQVNDAEWKSFKLREENLPEKGFLQSRASAAPVSKISPFLEEAFGSQAIDKSRIDFACATVDRGSDHTGFVYKGSMKAAMERCLPYPPMFEVQKSIASPFGVDDAAAWLRGRGANVIVLIDVLGQGEFLPSRSASEMSPENLLWGEIRREMYRAKPPIVNHVIHVNTAGHPVTDFDGRRALMDAGQKAATDVCNKMVSQYGF